VLSDLPGAQSALPSRGWSDDLCYGTGISYLTALSVGGAWGLAEGLQKNPPSMAPRLRLNGVLNAVTRRGPFLGNSAGVIAMVYNGMNSTIGYYRGKHDTTNSVVAGALSGALFKSTRGTRQIAISSGICASLAGGWAVSTRNQMSKVRTDTCPDDTEDLFRSRHHTNCPLIKSNDNSNSHVELASITRATELAHYFHQSSTFQHWLCSI
jgi:inner membrane translocase subunit Tim23